MAEEETRSRDQEVGQGSERGARQGLCFLSVGLWKEGKRGKRSGTRGGRQIEKGRGGFGGGGESPVRGGVPLERSAGFTIKIDPFVTWIVGSKFSGEVAKHTHTHTHTRTQ